MGGENAKGGGGLMKRGKHGRFSMLNSYLVDERGQGADYVGIGHDEARATMKRTGGTGVDMGKSKGDRFGKGSYLESSLADPDIKKSDFLNAHKDFGAKSTGGNGSFGKANADRIAWMRDNTVLADKDLMKCEGNHKIGTDPKPFSEIRDIDGESAIFKDKTHRFKEKEMDPGASNLGAAKLSDFEKPAPSCTVVYNKNRKHSRFSEFGSLYQQISTSSEQKTKDMSGKNVNKAGEDFAARIMEETESQVAEEVDNLEADTY